MEPNPGGPPAPVPPTGMTAQQLIQQLQDMQQQQAQMANLLQASQVRQAELETTVLTLQGQLQAQAQVQVQTQAAVLQPAASRRCLECGENCPRHSKPKWFRVVAFAVERIPPRTNEQVPDLATRPFVPKISDQRTRIQRGVARVGKRR